MKKIPWPVWLVVVLGWMAGADDYSHNGPISWLIGGLILVVAYYGEKLTQVDK